MLPTKTEEQAQTETKPIETNIRENEVEETKPRRKKFVLPEPPEITKKNPLKLIFHVGEQYLRKVQIKDDGQKKPIVKYFMSPLLSEWRGRMVPDRVNPRSHGPDCLTSHVAKEIEKTIHDKPEDFLHANRGLTILADELKFDKDTGNVELILTDPEMHGIADGATTDAVIAKVQAQDEESQNLQHARVNLEVVLNLEDRDRIASLVAGRNTSRQVRQWSLADFSGKFDWLKDILENNNQFKGKIGYEENAGKDVTVLDVLSILTLFHPEFNDPDKSLAIAYANKGRLNTRLDDPELLAGYHSLKPIIAEILNLHDYIYVHFETKYDEAFKGKSKLGKRNGVDSRKQGEPFELPLTGAESNYVISSSYIFPLLGAFRALVQFSRKDGTAKWRRNAFNFFDEHGAALIRGLIEQIDEFVSPNAAAKKKTTYSTLYNLAQAKLFARDDDDTDTNDQKGNK